jgi:hypothetical protein
MTWAAAHTSYPSTGTTLMTPTFGLSDGTGTPALGCNGIQVAATAGVDQRPRTAKLGRPPRGNHC